MVNKAIVVSDELLTLTDAQLAKRLKDYNFSCGPITGTTKGIYLKKLQEFINGTDGRSTPVKTTTPTSTPKTRRKTIATPILDIDSDSELPKPITSKYYLLKISFVLIQGSDHGP